MSATEILKAAESLPLNERIKLAQDLWENVSLQGYDPDELSLEVLDLGADDVESVNPGDEVLTIYTEPSEVEKVRQALEKHNYKVLKSESTLIPQTKIELAEEKVAHQAIRLIEKLEDLDDVQNVYTNADFSEAFAASYGA